MKKVITLALAAALAVSLVGCTTKPAAVTPPAPSQDAPMTQLVVGFDAEFPPYGYQDENGNYIGFDLDLAQEVATRNGWELVKKPIDWNSKDMELDSGAINCIWNGFTMNGREDKYTWSNPYVDNSQVVVVKSDSGIATLGDLAGRNLAVQADSSALHALQNEENAVAYAVAGSVANLMEVADYNTAFMNLEAGVVDAIAIDIGVATYQMAQRGDGFTLLTETLASEQYGIGFKLGNTALRDTVQATLDAMVADGGFQSIVDKWGEMGLATESVVLGK